MMKYLIDQILMRRRTVKRTTNDWDSAAYLEEDEDDTQQQRPSRSRRTLGHGNPRSGESGPSTSRRRVPLPSTSTERGSKWTRPQRSSKSVASLPYHPQMTKRTNRWPGQHKKRDIGPPLWNKKTTKRSTADKRRTRGH